MVNLNIACLQADITWQDRDANLERYGCLIDTIGGDTDLIVLPETFNTGFPVEAEAFSEGRDGVTMRWMSDMAKKKHAVVAGSLLLDEADGYYNTLVLASPDGSFRIYRKRHTFALGGEGEPIKRGNDKVIVEIKGWRIMPLVCYDLRFPVWSRNSFVDGTFAYDALLYVANFPDSRMSAWDTLLTARAIENQAYVVAVNRIGTSPDGTYYSGHSQAIDPRGSLMAMAADGKEQVVRVVLSGDDLLSSRHKFPVAQDWD